MRNIILGLFLCTTSTFVFGQKYVQEKDIENITYLIKNVGADTANIQLSKFRESDTIKDSNYVKLISECAFWNSRVGNVMETIRDCEEMITLLPKSEFAYLEIIGKFKIMLGDFNGALKCYKRMQELVTPDFNNFYHYEYLAQCYNQLGQFNEAIKTIQSNPKHKLFERENLQLAHAYFNINKLKLARNYLNIYIDNEYGRNDFKAYLLRAKIELKAKSKNACTFLSKSQELCSYFKFEEEIQKLPKKKKEIHFNQQNLLYTTKK